MISFRMSTKTGLHPTGSDFMLFVFLCFHVEGFVVFTELAMADMTGINVIKYRIRVGLDGVDRTMLTDGVSIGTTDNGTMIQGSPATGGDFNRAVHADKLFHQFVYQVLHFPVFFLSSFGTEIEFGSQQLVLQPQFVGETFPLGIGIVATSEELVVLELLEKLEEEVFIVAEEFLDDML